MTRRFFLSLFGALVALLPFRRGAGEVDGSNPLHLETGVAQPGQSTLAPQAFSMLAKCEDCGREGRLLIDKVRHLPPPGAIQLCVECMEIDCRSRLIRAEYVAEAKFFGLIEAGPLMRGDRPLWMFRA